MYEYLKSLKKNVCLYVLVFCLCVPPVCFAAGAECLDNTLRIRCAEYMGHRYAFDLNYHSDDSENINWKLDLASFREVAGCVKTGDDLKLAVSCAQYDGHFYAFDLYFYPNPNDPGGAYWKMDISSFRETGIGSDGCMQVKNDVKLNFSCVEYAGHYYAFDLSYYPNPHDNEGLYWKLDLNSFAEISSPGCVQVGEDLRMDVSCETNTGDAYTYYLNFFANPNDPTGVYWQSLVPGVGVTMQVTYSVPPIQGLPTTLGDDDNLLRFNFGNTPLAGEPGKPVLPVIVSSILLPSGYALDHVEIVQGENKNLPGIYTIEYGQMQYPLMPGVVPTLTAKDVTVYSSDSPYPGKMYDLVGIQKLRGVSIVNVNLHPVQYRPLSGKVAYYKDMTVKIVTKPLQNRRSSGDEDIRYRSSDIQAIAKRVDNPEVLSTYTEEIPGIQRRTGSLCNPADSFQYVLVTSNAIKNAGTSPNVNDLIAQRQSQGMSAKIVTIEDIYANYSGTDQAEQLRNFIKDAYNNWETDFLLLGGDTNIIPMRKLWCQAYSGGDEDHIPSDLYYQCLDGSYNSDGDDRWGEPTDGENGGDVDLYAEIYIGRASAENADEMANFLHKTLTYENSTSAYKKKILMLGEHLGFGGISEYAKDNMEEIRKGSSNHGYTTTGFASDSSFSVDGLYQKDTDWGKSDIISRINLNQYSVINHLGHAGFNYVMQMANWDTDSLSNASPLFAYSQGCIPGNFEEDCIAEHLTTSRRNGMFAVVFNSRSGFGTLDSTDGASQRYNREFWDAYFNEGQIYLGSMNAKSHEDNAWRIHQSCMRWCYYQTNLLGDPAVRFAVTASPKQPPVAEAGNEQTADVGNIVNLNGSGSSDPDGSIVSWFWEQTEGVSVTLTNANTVQPYFTAPDLGTEGGYLIFQLTVTDNDGMKATDTCKVNINGKPDLPVSFPDANLEAVIREAIGKPNGTIMQSDLDGMIAIDARSRGISNIEGIQYCTDLTWIRLESNQISNISPLAGLTNLTTLTLGENRITDVSALSGMKNMTYLGMNNNQISDISALSNLTNMTVLGLVSNQISNISVLSNMTKMTALYLESNQITDISALSRMTKLTDFRINNNQISNISALSGLTDIDTLLLHENRISDISALSGMKNITFLNLNSNQISDISALSNLTNLTVLALVSNQISNISVLSNMTKMTALYLESNQITDISALSRMTNLTDFRINNNQISNISALSGMKDIDTLLLHENQISNISALSGMKSMTYLNISDNQINDISALSALTNMNHLYLYHNQISEISPLVSNSGLSTGDDVGLSGNPLNATSCTQHIPTLQSRGVTVYHSCP